MKLSNGLSDDGRRAHSQVAPPVAVTVDGRQSPTPFVDGGRHWGENEIGIDRASNKREEEPIQQSWERFLLLGPSLQHKA